MAVLKRKGRHRGREEREAGSSLIEILEVCWWIGLELGVDLEEAGLGDRGLFKASLPVGSNASAAALAFGYFFVCQSETFAPDPGIPGLL